MAIRAFFLSLWDTLVLDQKLPKTASEILHLGRVSQTSFNGLLHALFRQEILAKMSNESLHAATIESLLANFDWLIARQNMTCLCISYSSEIEA